MTRRFPLEKLFIIVVIFVCAFVCALLFLFVGQSTVLEVTKKTLEISKGHKHANTKPQFTKSSDRFKEALNDRERSIFIKLLKSFTKVVPNNVTYFLYGGTLLGSYRHHGMIPWDDDLDISVRSKDKDVLLHALRSLEPEFKVDKRVASLWKFYHNSSTPTRHRWGAWPFIDIFFYVGNETHIWDTHPAIKSHKYAKRDVFPLKKRPFMGQLLPAPRNVTAFLSELFNFDICVSSTWSHKRQRPVKESLRVPCKTLRSRFSFVRRVEQAGSTLELLEKPGQSSSNSSVFVVHH